MKQFSTKPKAVVWARHTYTTAFYNMFQLNFLTSDDSN